MTREKLQKVQKLIQQRQLEGLMILNYVDFIYFTGSIQGNLLWIPAEGTPLFFSRRAQIRAQEEITLGESLPFKSYKEIRSHLKNLSGQFGFLMDSVPVSLFQKILSDLGLNCDQAVDFSADLRTLKMVKEAHEIEKIRGAGKILELAYRQWEKMLRPGMTEMEAAIALESLLRQNGHLGENRFKGFNQIGLPTYVVSGKNVYTPAVHDTPYGGQGVSKAIGVGSSHKKILPGEPFMADSVANFEGYHSDCTRTFIFGEPSNTVKKHYKALLALYHEIIENLKPGISCESVYEKSLDTAKKLGYENHFMGIRENRVGFIGHGIGIHVDEFPVFASRFKTQLEPGMTVALEPKLFLEEIGGVGLETTFLITDRGAESLCDLEDHLRILPL